MSNAGCPCGVLNRHMHPEPLNSCEERCCMCTGYCCPAGVAVMVVGLVVSYIVFFCLLMASHPSAWRIVVSIVFILVILFLGPTVLWSYYKVIYTRPGYVSRDPWRYKPQFRYIETGLEARSSDPSQVTNAGRAGALGGQQRQRTSPSSQDGAAGPAEDGRGGNPLARQPKLGAGPDSSSYPSSSYKLEKGGADVEGVPLMATMSSNDSTAASGAQGDRAGGGGRHAREDPSDAASSDACRRETEGAGVAAGSSPQHPVSHRDATDMHDVAVAVSSSAQPRGAPGAAKSEAETDPSTRNPYVVTQLDRNGRPRYCQICMLYKPDLAYHCGTCRRCVYNFDHHCPYINNCVGRNNYKLFVIFLMYAGYACLISGVLMLIGIFAMDPRDVFDKIGWIAVPILMCILGFALTGFYCEHRCLIHRGKSTVESVVERRIKEEKRREKGYNPFSEKRRRWYSLHPTVELTDEEQRRVNEQKRKRIEAHRTALLGNETGWQAYLPYAIRTDDTAEGIAQV